MKRKVLAILAVCSISMAMGISTMAATDEDIKTTNVKDLNLFDISSEIDSINQKIKNDIDKLLNHYDSLISSITIKTGIAEEITESTTEATTSSQTTETSTEVNKYQNEIYEVFELTNAERTKNGLNLLELDGSLIKSAQGHAEDMYNNSYFSHTSLDGRTLSDRIFKYSREFNFMGENIAKGQNSPKSVIDSWMSSQGHRENILNPNYKKIGIGYYKDYWVQNFGG